MNTIKMTLKYELLGRLDEVFKQLDTSRSAFARNVLRDAREKHSIRRQEKRQREGYRKQPMDKALFDPWEEQTLETSLTPGLPRTPQC